MQFDCDISGMDPFSLAMMHSVSKSDHSGDMFNTMIA